MNQPGSIPATRKLRVLRRLSRQTARRRCPQCPAPIACRYWCG